MYSWSSFFVINFQINQILYIFAAMKKTYNSDIVL